MNIIIGKFGKSIIFRNEKWGIIGGDSESAVFIWTMAHLYPNYNFYIVSRNDFSTLPPHIKTQINKNNNIIDCWEHYNKDHDNQEWLSGFFDIQPDFGLLYSGLSGGNTIKNFLLKKDGSGYAKPISFSKNYTGIITNYLNKSGVPYLEIGEDSRFFPLEAKDLINRSKRILSVKDTETVAKHIKSKEDQQIVETKIPISDVGHSYACLMNEDRKKLLKRPNSRNTLISIIMHGTASHHKSTDKYGIVKDYILSNFPETMIYGKWEMERVEEQYHDRFIETPMIDLHPQLYDTKYTLSIGGSNGYPTSSKFWKMLIFGIIPFFIKKEDTEKFGVPEYLWVKDSFDFKKKIGELESDVAKYNDLWYNVQDVIQKDDLWNGHRFYDNIEKYVYKDFGYKMERTGEITYRSSSIFVNDNKNNLEEFFNG